MATTTTDTDTTVEPAAVEADPRSAYTAGLRALADILDAHPEVPLPFDGVIDAITFHFLSGEDPKDALITAMRAFPGKKTKEPVGAYFQVSGQLHGLRYELTAFRDEVCERVVTGTREVTREVPDPEALKAVPTTTVTETVEDVEWVCQPLLATDAPVSV